MNLYDVLKESSCTVHTFPQLSAEEVQLQLFESASSVSIFLLTLKRSAFRFSLVQQLHESLELIEKHLKNSQASFGYLLIVTGENDKFSTGLDLGKYFEIFVDI